MNSTNKLYLLFIFALILLDASYLHSQNSSLKTSQVIDSTKNFNFGVLQDSNLVSKKRFWVEASFGFGLNASLDDLYSLNLCGGLALDFHYIKKNYRHFQIHTAYQQDAAVFTNFSQQMGELGLMFGKISPRKHTQVQASIGFGLSGGYRHGEVIGSSGWFNIYYKRQAFITPSLMLDLKSSVFLGRKFGVGIGLNGNINLYFSYLALKVYFQFNNAKKS